jgi:hypothetical protein
MTQPGLRPRTLMLPGPSLIQRQFPAHARPWYFHCQSALRSAGVNWSLFDFVFMGVLIGSVVVAARLAFRTSRNTAYRVASAIAIATAFLLIWINGAVGIIGDENNDANLMFIGVLFISGIGALIARGEPARMAKAMYATATAQAIVAVIELIARFGASDPSWPREIVVLTVIFCGLWLVSANRFQKAAREQAIDA